MNSINKDKLNHTASILSNAITEVSIISQQMMPRTLRENGLISAIESLLENTLSKTSIKYKFQKVNLNGRLPENVEVGLYRIAQELIGNIVKHSGASEVIVQLTRTQKNILLTIEDNGKGIPKVIHKRGMGLDNVKSRAETLTGNFHYESEIGKGTISTIRIPF